MKRINSLHVWIIVIAICSIVWSGVFIYKSSFITIDGQRSYSLFDDAMISMRYAWNFSHGYGLVWNPGEYVQGYTNLLMVLIMSLATLVLSRTTAVLAIQLLGLFFMFMIAYLNVQIAIMNFMNGDEGRDRLVILFALLCSLSYYPLLYWSLMGMETGLLCVLLLGGVYYAFQFSRSRQVKHLFHFSIIGGFAFLTRNDSLIYFSILWAYLYMGNIWKQKDKEADRWFYALAGLYIVFIVGQSFFQYFYYGEVLPNTYVLKMTGMPILPRLQNGLGFTLPFLKESAFVILLSLLALLFQYRSEKLLLFILFSVSVLYQIFVGGDPWNYWRMTAPTMPLLLLLSIDSIFVLTRYLAWHGKSDRSPALKTIELVFVMLCLVSVNYRFREEILFQAKPYQTTRNEKNVNTAIALNDILYDEATVGVFWAGTIPYYVDNVTIDFLGKSDRYIANLPPDISGSVAFFSGMNSMPGHNKYDLNYSIVVLKPTYVQRLFWGSQNVYSLVEDEYVEVKYRYSTLYLRRDSADVNWERLGKP